MSGEMVEVKTRDGVADAYLARPADAAGPLPAVLLLGDIFGLRPQIERMADRIAARGYVVLAPNVFYRAGRAPLIELDGLADPERRGAIFAQARPLMKDLTDELIVADGDAYLSFLEEVGRGPVAISGYCMGGRLGWRIAAAYPERVAVLAGFHTGGLVTEDENSPHLSAGEIGAEVYLGHADNDKSMTAENIAAVEDALDEVGATYTSKLYEGAAHGYTMADAAAYDEAAAELHFDELFALLDRTVAG
ncbi:MAG: dienelactone hydrolase family protein [Solirubrobacterales bacterium]